MKFIVPFFDLRVKNNPLKTSLLNSLISFNEFSSPPISTFASYENFKDLIIEKNSPDDIVSAVDEMIDKVINKKNNALNNNQKKFNIIVKKNFYKYDNNLYINASISKNFIDKYENLLVN